MDITQIAGILMFLVLAVGAFVISYVQFKEKGCLFNNAYLWASQEERKRMDENKESKRPYYRQSGFVFMLIGIICLIFAAYIAVGWTWMYIAFWILIIIAVVYAVVSSVKIERHQQD